MLNVDIDEVIAIVISRRSLKTSQNDENLFVNGMSVSVLLGWGQ